MEIKKKQKDIDQRNKIITDRMLDEQAVTGTNMDVEVIMGSKDLVDMIRKVDGLQRITDSDAGGKLKSCRRIKLSWIIRKARKTG